MSLPSSAASAGTVPEAPSPAPPSETPLTLRQEAFCRHYAATGNAAGAARDAGYAEGSARQTGHDLLDRPDIAGRVRTIRAAWRAVERAEAQILLGRLEQAWDAAVEQGSASLMIRVVKLAGRAVRPRPAQRPPARRPVAPARREVRRRTGRRTGRGAR